ncbi:MAG: pyridoxal 5'-phosphate synthase glutaminase subunit PdxT [Candidatus Thermoplasmatota archaeon]|nr:pyridoxal 5'-phosphate synthase glutaminase subunit PdxT [Candidatus Thermoplasmatota archaeon]MBU1941602.1 pyridoxal 5'-phosphate synthase glutaminase subunit PdxT [Candidatus Thermoplasmatota archaeon]
MITGTRLVRIVVVGVLCIQGAVSEHLAALENTFHRTGISGKAIMVRKPPDLNSVDAMIIPGGESTTISRILTSSGLYTSLLHRIRENDIAIMGTCAGCVLLAQDVIGSNIPKDLHVLKAMTMRVKRNAFGRQRESFEQPINISGLTDPFPAVFIRAPIITEVFTDCQPIGRLDDQIVAAQQKGFLALSFHPELTNDIRLHHYFLKMI